jgi:hypothetical protein
MEQQAETEHSSPPEERSRVLDERFQALPPLGLDEYVRYLDAEPTQELPPEVFVRAFRQLPHPGAAARKTLERLFRRLPDGSWEFLEPMVRYARRKGRSRKTDDEDLLQDGLTRILRVLSGKRGQRAETAWNAYCRQEIIDALRERYGRRGEHFTQFQHLIGTEGCFNRNIRVPGPLNSAESRRSQPQGPCAHDAPGDRPQIKRPRAEWLKCLRKNLANMNWASMLCGILAQVDCGIAPATSSG